MTKATEYRMLVFADKDTSIHPLVDLAQQIDGKWLSLWTEKTAEQLNEETATSTLLALDTTGSATYHGPVKLVSYAYGQRLCREWERAEAEREKTQQALPASYHAARARRFSATH
jgi:hypothetical protein